MKRHYDYIIAGGGLAGISLVHFLQQSSLRDKRILIIDKSEKLENDRTWCFWEREKSPFEFLVHHRWQHLDFHTPDFSQTLNIEPYTYKMIRGIDFYQYGKEMLISRPNVDKSVENVQKVVNTDSGVLVTTAENSYTADFCFNSIRFEKINKKENHYLDQHFKGWTIRTKEPFFSPDKATLMDFRVPHQGETRFVYVLPTSENEALIEATLFSPDLLQSEEYDRIITDYIQEFLPGIGEYEVTHEEFGVIPMTDFKFSAGNKNIVNIGTAGGNTKASSGYTFCYLQKHLQKMVAQLEKTGSPYVKKTIRQRRSAWLDRIFLNVLQHHRVPPPEVFGTLFENNKPSQVLKFMSEETSFPEEIKIMSTMQIFPFFRAMLSTMNPAR
jgi:lycopene beta-cyclase